MYPLPIDPRVVDECKDLADRVAGPVQSFINGHSTVSIERTVLRSYGVDGADDQGVPLVNRCVDRYKAAGLLDHGVALFLGMALARTPHLTPQEAAEELAYGDAPGLSDPAEVLRSEVRERAQRALAEPTRRAIAAIDEARQKRISVGADDFYLDLLFYHRHLRRLVAVELKLEKFQPAHKGQMELYLRWLDKHERAPGEEAPIGLILCAAADAEQVELLQLDAG